MIHDFSEYLYVKEFQDNNVMKLGEFTLDEDGELAYLMPLIYISNFSELEGFEKLTLQIYNDNKFNSLLTVSETVNIGDISNTVVVDEQTFLGYIMLHLERLPVTTNQKLYIKSIISDYTSTSSLQIAHVYDYPVQIYSNSETFFYKKPLCCKVYLYQGLGN